MKHTSEWYQSHLTLGKKANKHIFQNVKLFLEDEWIFKKVFRKPLKIFTGIRSQSVSET